MDKNCTNCAKFNIETCKWHSNTAIPSGFVCNEYEMKNQGETVNHPQHYNQVPGIECIEVIEHFNLNRGNALKYIWRAGYKGNEVEDLRKAIWYLEREIERIETKNNE